MSDLSDEEVKLAVGRFIQGGLPEQATVASALVGARLLSVTDEEDEEGCEWTVLDFENGFTLHFLGQYVLVHPLRQ